MFLFTVSTEALASALIAERGTGAAENIFKGWRGMGEENNIGLRGSNLMPPES